MRYFSLGALAVLTFGLFTSAAYAIVTDEAILRAFALAEQTYQLPTGILAKIAQVESGGDASRVNTSSRTRASGLFQWVPRYWPGASRAVYGQPRNIQDIFNPYISTEVTAFHLGRFKGNNMSLIQQAQADMYAALYIGHFLGPGGGRRFLQLLVTRPDDPAPQWFPNERDYNPTVFNGRTIRGVYNWAAEKMRVPGITGITNYTGTYDGGNLNGRIIDQAGIGALARPFNGQIPPGIASFSYPSTYTQADLNPPQQPNSNSQSSTTPLTAGATQSAALIIAQPQTARAGEKVLVSWTSVGMQNGSCSMRTWDGTEFARSSEGTREFTLPASAPSSGRITFELSCTDPSNLSVLRQVTIPFNQ